MAQHTRQQQTRSGQIQQLQLQQVQQQQQQQVQQQQQQQLQQRSWALEGDLAVTALAARQHQHQQQAAILGLEQAQAKRLRAQALAHAAAVGAAAAPIPGLPRIGIGSATAAAAGPYGVGGGGISSLTAQGNSINAPLSPGTSGIGKRPWSEAAATISRPASSMEAIDLSSSRAAEHGGTSPAALAEGQDEGRKKSRRMISAVTHQVLETPLAGPFVRGMLEDDEQTLINLRDETGVSPKYVSSQILHLAEIAPFPSNDVTLTMANVEKLGLRICDGHNRYAKKAVEIASEEMRRKHADTVLDMHAIIQRLEKEVEAATSSTSAAAGTTNDGVSAGAAMAAAEAAKKEANVAKKDLERAKEWHERTLIAEKALHASQLKKAKKANDEVIQQLNERHDRTVNSLKAELLEAKTTHSRCLDGYLKASCEVLKQLELFV